MAGPGRPGRPPGVPNKDKSYRDALRRAIARAEREGKPHSLDRIAVAHLRRAAAGDIQAIKELADRLDGKVPQAITGLSAPVTVQIVRFGDGPGPGPDAAAIDTAGAVIEAERLLPAATAPAIDAATAATEEDTDAGP